MVSVADLKNYDAILALDHSGSTAQKDGTTQTRWQRMREGAVALAGKMAEFDSDGIDVLAFNDSVKHYPNITDATSVDNIWNERDPMGGTSTHLVIRKAAELHFSRKGQGKAGTILVIATDGEANDPQSVRDEIIALSKKLDKNEEFGITFVQVGSDPTATAYLKTLDDGLVAQGAKFDIVDTVTFEQAGQQPLAELFINALVD